MDTALAAYERAMPNGPRDFLKPEALVKSEQAITDAERTGIEAEKLSRMRVEYDERSAMAAVHKFTMKNGAAVVERLRALKDQACSMATNQAFLAEAIAPTLADMQAIRSPLGQINAPCVGLPNLALHVAAPISACRKTLTL